MKNLIVGQSGGPTAVINSSLYGVIREGFNRSEEIEHVYGMINGIQGFLDGRFMDMKELDNDTLEALRTTPGAYLGSCRFKLPDNLNDAIYPLLFQKFEEMNIGYFFYIGGNDSMDTVSKLSRYAKHHGSDIRFIGISIDQNEKLWVKRLKKDGMPAHIQEVLADPYVVGDAWDITSIPRFLLIDENFRIINAFAPRPSDREKIEPLLAR